MFRIKRESDYYGFESINGDFTLKQIKHPPLGSQWPEEVWVNKIDSYWTRTLLGNQPVNIDYEALNKGFYQFAVPFDSSKIILFEE